MGAILAVLWAVSAGAFTALALAALGRFGDLIDTLDGIQRVMREGVEGPAAGMEARFRDLEDLVDRLPARWEEIKRESNRLDARARYAVGRARKELSESGYSDERLEDLGRELQLVDGDGGEDGGVLAMREDVAGASDPAPTEPEAWDWESVARQRKFGA